MIQKLLIFIIVIIITLTIRKIEHFNLPEAVDNISSLYDGKTLMVTNLNVSDTANIKNLQAKNLTNGTLIISDSDISYGDTAFRFVDDSIGIYNKKTNKPTDCSVGKLKIAGDLTATTIKANDFLKTKCHRKMLNTLLGDHIQINSFDVKFSKLYTYPHVPSVEVCAERCKGFDKCYGGSHNAKSKMCYLYEYDGINNATYNKDYVSFWTDRRNCDKVNGY
jgi:hypothetical protein